jgi:ubiquitin C-terminal hydrolase
MFAMPIQNDAQEYLGYLLDKFHEELKVQVDVPDVVPQDMAGMAKQAWDRFLSKNTSVVVETFFGMMRKMVICSNCSTRTYQWELFNMLKIPCYGGATLHDWIEKEVNEVTDIDAFKCNTCDAKHPAKKYSHLWKLPQHLFIVLDRFQPNGMKAINVCPIMERLSFPQYFAEEAQNLGLHHNGYQLCGIADHHGGQIHGGHYTAQFKHPITGDWWFFDDERAHEMHAPQFSSSAYILSYRMD